MNRSNKVLLNLISLHYCVHITQSTGKDWTADMDLSNKTIPVFRPMKIQPPTRSLFGFEGFGAGGRLETLAQKPPLQAAFGSVPAALNPRSPCN